MVRFIFFSYIASFVLLLLVVFLDFVRGPLFLLFPLVNFLLGVWLLIVALKHKKSKLRNALVASSLSGIGFFVFMVLHNLFYALASVSASIALLFYLCEALHVIFFLIGVVICPIAFIVSSIIVLFLFRSNYH